MASWWEVSMRRVIQSVLAAAILLGTASTTHAESVMKQCGEQWQAAKAAGTTSGATWPQFLGGRNQRLVPSFDGCDDFFGVLGPGERLWAEIVLGDVAVDGALEIDDRAEDTAL